MIPIKKVICNFQTSDLFTNANRFSARIIHEAWASTWRRLVSLGYCFMFVDSTVHPRGEINEFAKRVATSGELNQRANRTPVVVNNSGSVLRTKGHCPAADCNSCRTGHSDFTIRLASNLAHSVGTT